MGMLSSLSRVKHNSDTFIESFQITSDIFQEGVQTPSLAVSKRLQLSGVRHAEFLNINQGGDIDLVVQHTTSKDIILYTDYNASSGTFTSNKVIYDFNNSLSDAFFDIKSDGNKYQSLIVMEQHSSVDSVSHIYFNEDETLLDSNKHSIDIDRSSLGSIKEVSFEFFGQLNDTTHFNGLIVHGENGFQVIKADKESLISEPVISSGSNHRSLEFVALSEYQFKHVVLTHSSGIKIYEPSIGSFSSITDISTSFVSTLYKSHDRKLLLTLSSDGKLDVYESGFKVGPTEDVSPADDLVSIVNNADEGANIRLIPDPSTGNKIFTFDSLRIRKPVYITSAVNGIVFRSTSSSLNSFIQIDSVQFGKVSNVTIEGNSTGIQNGTAVSSTMANYDFKIDSVTIRTFDTGISLNGSSLEIHNTIIDSTNIGIYAEHSSSADYYTHLELDDITFTNQQFHAVFTKNIRDVELEHVTIKNSITINNSALIYSLVDDNRGNSDDDFRVEVVGSKFENVDGSLIKVVKDASVNSEMKFQFEGNRVNTISSDSTIIQLDNLDELFFVNNVISNVNSSVFNISTFNTDSGWSINNIFENVATDANTFVYEYESDKDTLFHMFNHAFIGVATSKMMNITGTGKPAYGNIAFTETFSSVSDTLGWGIHLTRSPNDINDGVTFIFNENYSQKPGSFGIDQGIVEPRLIDPDGSVSNIGLMQWFESDEPFSVITEKLHLGKGHEQDVLDWNDFSDALNKDSLEAYYLFWGNTEHFTPDTSAMVRIDKSQLSYSIDNRNEDRHYKIAANHLSNGVISYSNSVFVPAHIEFIKDSLHIFLEANSDDSVRLDIHSYSGGTRVAELHFRSISNNVHSIDSVRLIHGLNSTFIKSSKDQKYVEVVGYLKSHDVIEDSIHIIIERLNPVSFTQRNISNEFPYNKEIEASIRVFNPDRRRFKYELEYNLINQADKGWLAGDSIFISSENEFDSVRLKISTTNVATTIEQLRAEIYLKSDTVIYDTLSIHLTLIDPKVITDFVHFSSTIDSLARFNIPYTQSGAVLEWKGNSENYLFTTYKKSGNEYVYQREDSLLNIRNIAVNSLDGFYRFIVSHLNGEINAASDTVDLEFRSKQMSIEPGFWQLVTTNIKSETGTNPFEGYSGSIYVWDNATEEYKSFSSENVNDLSSYWVKPTEKIFYKYSEDLYSAEEDELTVSLKKGWNQVGQPWDWPILWKSQEIEVDGQFISVLNANSLNLEAFHYISNENASNTSTTYDSTYTYVQMIPESETFGKIYPRKGFWVFVNQDTRFRFKNVQHEDILQKESNVAESSIILSAKSESYESKLFVKLNPIKNKQYHYRPPIFNSNDVFNLSINSRSVMGITEKTPKVDEIKEYTFSVWGKVNEKKQVFINIENHDGLYYWIYQISKGKPERINGKKLTTFQMKKNKETVKLYVSSDVNFEPKIIPLDFKLHQNYPNPFNPSTTIKVDIPFIEGINRYKTRITVFNILGQKVKTLFNGYLTAAQYEFKWKGRNEFGAKVASGVYFYQVQAGRHVSSKKMVLIK